MLYARGVKSTIKAAVSWPLFLEMRDRDVRRGWPGHRAGGALGGEEGETVVAKGTETPE